MKNYKSNDNQPCPCDSNKEYEDCCQPYIKQLVNAPTAEALMRSRYTAFTMNDEVYLRYSWHPDNCPKSIHVNESTYWLGLKIKSTKNGTADDDTGEVEFVARNKTDGKANRLHENSQFVRYQDHWVYTTGKNIEK